MRILKKLIALTKKLERLANIYFITLQIGNNEFSFICVFKMQFCYFESSSFIYSARSVNTWLSTPIETTFVSPSKFIFPTLNKK